MKRNGAMQDATIGEIVRARAQPDCYRAARQPRWISIMLIVLVHVAGLSALLHAGPAIIRPAPTVPLVIDLIPPPPPAMRPKPVTLPVNPAPAAPPVPQRIVTPPVILRSAPSPVDSEPASPPDAIPLPPASSPEAPVAKPVSITNSPSITDLNTRLLAADPPPYPVEARRRRYAGTVILLVVVDEAGRVAEISVSSSSGIDQLDKSALVTVRRWRWSPTIVDGRPVRVKGLVRIPFILRVAGNRR